jgi:2-polyprenyl-6-methoxyphenol hydroxylase-like FAD-dependent oxidoreductase
VTERGEADVLVVGAGSSGLTLAGLLRAMDVTVRIIDRQLDRVRDSRALAADTT